MKHLISLIALAILAATLWLNSSQADASTASATILSVGQRLKVLANGCSLNVTTNTPTLVKVKCTGVANPADAPALPNSSVTLAAGQRVTARPNNCNLAVIKNTSSVVKVACNPIPNTVMVGQNGTNFSPGEIDIHVGDTVHWSWASSDHTVNSGTFPTADDLFCSPSDSGCSGETNPTSNSGATYDHTFNSVGTFNYFCKIHGGSGMIGKVVVSSP